MGFSTVEKKIRLTNKAGLHARPASKIVETANNFDSEITISKEDFNVSGKSVMGVLMLAAECGVELSVKAVGSDAEEAVDAILELIRGKFGEE